MSGNLCRCGAYGNIVAAIEEAQPLMAHPDQPQRGAKP
jgi:xanthine dehydrogenase YagT iron-sulfur-binding subunit